MKSMDFTFVHPNDDLSEIVKVLQISHETVAKEFGFTIETNPTNNAFIEASTLKNQLNNGIELYALSLNSQLIGCIAIEKSKRASDTFYIEKVSVIPEQRNHGIGVQLMDFAVEKIKEAGGKNASIALIDSNTKLKNWYSSQGFIETGTKDFEQLPFRVCFMNKEL